MIVRWLINPGRPECEVTCASTKVLRSPRAQQMVTELSRLLPFARYPDWRSVQPETTEIFDTKVLRSFEPPEQSIAILPP
jgi:hypothetical protein